MQKAVIFGSVLPLDIFPPYSTFLWILSQNLPSNSKIKADMYITQARKALFGSSYKK